MPEFKPAKYVIFIAFTLLLSLIGYSGFHEYIAGKDIPTILGESDTAAAVSMEPEGNETDSEVKTESEHTLTDEEVILLS